MLASGNSDLTRCHKTEVVPSWEDSDGDYDDTGLPDAKAKLSFFDIGWVRILPPSGEFERGRHMFCGFEFVPVLMLQQEG